MRTKQGSDQSVGGLQERHAWALLAVAAAAWYLPFALVPGHVGFVADDALYLMTADWMQGAWQHDPVLLYVRSVNHLPPFYPLLLSLAGGGSAQVDIAHLLQAACLIAGLVAHGVLARRLIGSGATALVFTATLLLLPLTLIMATEIWSEFLYLLLVALTLIAADGAGTRGSRWLAAAGLAGLAAVTRGFGIVAVIALVLASIRRQPRQTLPILVVSLAPLLLVEALDLGGGTSYVDVFIERVQTPSRIPGFIAANLAALDHALWQAFALPRPAASMWFILAALVPVLRTLASRLRAGHADALYLIGYAMLLVIWPFPAVMDRLLFPILPLLLIYLLTGLACRPAPRRMALLAAVMLLVATLVQVAPMARRYMDAQLPAELSAWRASRYWLGHTDASAARDRIERLQSITDLLRRAGARVPLRECVNSDHPQAVMFHARRLSWPAPRAGDSGRATCRFRLLTAPLPDSEPIPLKPGGRVVDRAHANARIVGLLVDYHGTAGR